MATKKTVVKKVATKKVTKSKLVIPDMVFGGIREWDVRDYTTRKITKKRAVADFFGVEDVTHDNIYATFKFAGFVKVDVMKGLIPVDEKNI